MRHITHRGDSVAMVGCLLREIQSRKGMIGILAVDLYIGGPTGGVWGPIRAGQWACVGPGFSGDQLAGPCSPLVHREHRLIINTLSLSLYIYIYKCYLSP
jgi:hypothetical protein